MIIVQIFIDHNENSANANAIFWGGPSGSILTRVDYSQSAKLTNFQFWRCYEMMKPSTWYWQFSSNEMREINKLQNLHWHFIASPFSSADGWIFHDGQNNRSTSSSSSLPLSWYLGQSPSASFSGGTLPYIITRKKALWRQAKFFYIETKLLCL